jgi:hypothetical protein
MRGVFLARCEEVFRGPHRGAETRRARRKGTVRGRFFTGVAIECLIVGVESNSALWDIIWRQ